jgi:hypothetical protein
MMFLKVIVPSSPEAVETAAEAGTPYNTQETVTLYFKVVSEI